MDKGGNFLGVGKKPRTEQLSAANAFYGRAFLTRELLFVPSPAPIKKGQRRARLHFMAAIGR